jgi:hypothetical protein
LAFTLVDFTSPSRLAPPPSRLTQPQVTLTTALHRTARLMPRTGAAPAMVFFLGLSLVCDGDALTPPPPPRQPDACVGSFNSSNVPGNCRLIVGNLTVRRGGA